VDGAGLPGSRGEHRQIISTGGGCFPGAIPCFPFMYLSGFAGGRCMPFESGQVDGEHGGEGERQWRGIKAAVGG
jgi:hypothetical protein